MNKVILIFTIVSIGLNALTLKAPLTFEEMSMETRAELAEM
jgi:hypothetical protein